MWYSEVIAQPVAETENLSSLAAVEADEPAAFHLMLDPSTGAIVVGEPLRASGSGTVQEKGESAERRMRTPAAVLLGLSLSNERKLSGTVETPITVQPSPAQPKLDGTVNSAYAWNMTYRDDQNRLSTEYSIASGLPYRTKDYFYFGNLLVATTDLTCAPMYYVSDHLGTPRVVFDGGATTRDIHKYLPYGTELTTGSYCLQPEPLKFAQMERDASSGNDYDHARFHLTGMGRFLGVDRIGAGVPGDPVSWNRYTYARANPIKYYDADGQAWDLFTKIAQAYRAIDNYVAEAFSRAFPVPQGQANDPNREALNDESVGNTQDQTERLVNPAGAAQSGLNEAGSTLAAEAIKQGGTQFAVIGAGKLLDFAAGGLETHFEKHGAEFGLATKEEYLAGARALADGGEGVASLSRKNGDRVFYRAATNEFAVVAKDGTIKTYFKPGAGQQYFENQAPK